MAERNIVERLRAGLETAQRTYEQPERSFFWPDDPDGQAEIIRWFSGIVHEPRWPIQGRKAAYTLLQQLAGEVETFHPTARKALEAAAVEVLATGPPKMSGRPSAAWRDKAIVDMYRSLRRKDYQRHVAVGLLAQAADIDKDTLRGVLRAAGID